VWTGSRAERVGPGADRKYTGRSIKKEVALMATNAGVMV